MQPFNSKIREGLYCSALFLILFCTALSVASCASSIPEASISGTIVNAPNRLLIFREAADNTVYSIDSCRTDGNGTFKVSLPINTPTFILVQMERELEPIILLVSPGEQVAIKSKAGSFARTYSVGGSMGSEAIKQLNGMLNSVVTRIDSLSFEFRNHRELPDFAKVKRSIDSTYNRIVDDHKAFTVRFIKENRYNLASILALYQEYDATRRVLDSRNDFYLFQLVDSSLFPLYPNNKLVQNLNANVRKLSRQLELIERSESMLDVGQVIPIENWPLFPEGTISARDITSRYTLIFFWGTWCNDCIPANKGLTKLYQEFSGKGFDIIQISLDDNPEVLEAYLQGDSLVWRHVLDQMEWNSPIVEELRISSIPSSYLIDRQARVVGVNMSYNELVVTLRELLK